MELGVSCSSKLCNLRNRHNNDFQRKPQLNKQFMDYGTSESLFYT